MRHKILFPVFVFLMIALSVNGKQKEFVLPSGGTVEVACSNSEELVVRTALEMLSRDIRTVLSASVKVSETGGEIIIGTLGRSKLLEQSGADISELIDNSQLRDKKQGFLLAVSEGGKLVVAGSDSHGTAYGILEISRLLGVSPWEWWADVAQIGRAHV